MRKIFGLPTYREAPRYGTDLSRPTKEEDPVSPPRQSPLSIPHILGPETPPLNLKRERRDSFTPDLSDDEESRIHATFLLNLASPEAASRAPSEATLSPPVCRKKSRYADTMTQPFSQMVRPAYEYMSDPASLGAVCHLQHGYNAPQSPPQSPPMSYPRPRARPYYPFHSNSDQVGDVLDEHRDATRILNSDLSFQIGHVIKTTNHVQKTLRSVGAINAGAIKGTKAVYFD